MASSPTIIDPASQLILPPSARGPLVRVARVKWERDPEMSELIDYFDEPRFHGPKIKSDNDRFALLTVREVETIQGIIARCRGDFSYAARNFFWITNKKRGEQLFKLWESQELIYEHLVNLKRKGLMMKLMLLKARQLGCSTLVEGLIAWRSMFFKNVNAIVVSFDAEHAAYLFSIMQYIYDRMPWWLKPQCSSREYKDGLKFENPDYDDRRKNPGLNSAVMVQAANKRTGVGQGVRISAAHLSEYADWHPDYARDVIEEDLGNALAEDDPDMFAILESTAKGAGNYSYRLWNKNVELGEQAEWHALFLPWFFERTRFIAPPGGWRPEPPELEMNERVKSDWLRCNNENCEQYQQKYRRSDGDDCPTCGSGKLDLFALKPGQMYWMQRKRKNSEKEAESLKKLRQEMACVTGESRISSERGIVRIDTASAVSKTETGEVSKWYDHGKRETLKVTTVMGRVLTCTPEHRFFSPEDRETEACQLKAGDALQLSPPRFSDEYATVQWDVTPYCKAAITVDEDFGRLLGYFMGDGCWRGSGINFAVDSQDADVVQDVRRVAEKATGKPCDLQVRGKMELVISSDSHWYSILKALGALRKNCSPGRSEKYKKLTRGYIRNVCVPDCIWRSPKSVVKEFLSALVECDGHGYKDSPKTVFFTCHQEFARDIQILLLGFGINSAITYEPKKHTDGHEYAGYNVRMKSAASNAFHSEIGFISHRKRTTACVRPARRKGAFDNSMQDVVLSVEDAGIQNVYDLTIKDVHRFGANGLLVHNTTAEEAFQLSGVSVFGEGAQDYVNNSVRVPMKEGFLDNAGNFHGPNPRNIKRNPVTNEFYEGCYIEGCDQDHQYGDENGEKPYHVWKEPEKDAEYCIGGDVSEGLGGEFDYSVGFVIKINRKGGPDEHVATFRSNRIDPVSFAQVLNFMGRAYNEALMAIEVNRYDTCLSWIRFQLQYPNLYRWKYMDSINTLSNKLGWVTSVSSKPRLYQTMKRWLNAKLFVVYSRNFASEMKTFTKDEDERAATAETGSYDDEIMAAMIALYCAHEGDWDDSLGQMAIKRELSMDDAPWHMACGGCQLVWPAHNNTDKKCPRCGCMVISGKANRDPSAMGNQADAFINGSISKEDAKEFAVSITQDKSAEEPDYSVPFVCG